VSHWLAAESGAMHLAEMQQLFTVVATQAAGRGYRLANAQNFGPTVVHEYVWKV
jgi:hypothetical protein